MSKLRGIIAGILLLIGVGWLLILPHGAANRIEAAQNVPQLVSGMVANMESPVFHYSDGWQIDATGADPREPADPFATPSGVISFTYQGSEVALLLATGNYWGYLYATVDGAPANLLADIAGNRGSHGQAAGYTTFYVPENQREDGPGEQWIRLHTASPPDVLHQVRIEVWRSWGQHPIRAVAVDALPTPARPRWPGILLIVLGLAVLTNGWRRKPLQPESQSHLMGEIKPSTTGFAGIFARLSRFSLWLALIGLVATIVGTAWTIWWLSLAGVALLALAALMQPVLWLAALLVGLPFYFAFDLPLLPGRSFGIMDVGIFGGTLFFIANFLLSHLIDFQGWQQIWKEIGGVVAARRLPFVAWIAGWALVTTFAADHVDVALREWRTVFLAGMLFGWMLYYVSQQRSGIHLGGESIRKPQAALSHQALLLSAWLLGAAAIALIGLWAYATHYEPYLVAAEGVTRLRSIYGSPNNLAAYLERTLAVTLAVTIFSRQRQIQLAAALLALPQAVAFLLTYSKGGIFFGLPAMLLTLTLGGIILLRKEGRSLRLLWALAAVMILVALALLPVLGAERLRGLLDPASATSLMRINLWRSSWQMALDHGLLGVGPDNFLYTYRSHYLLPAAWQEPNLNHPHDFLLDWWTRLGVPGLVLGMGWWGSIGNKLWREIRDWRLEIGSRQSPISNLQSPILALGLLAALAASLAHGLIDISYALPDLMIVWVLLDEIGNREHENE